MGDLSPVSPKVKTILVADDEKIIVEMVKEYLSELGFNVLVAFNGREVLDIINRQGTLIELALLDIRMPVVDGLTAVSVLKSHYPGIKIILMTGYLNYDLTGTDIDRLIEKPIQLERIGKMIEEMLED
ncbi:MAG: response regulator [Deltaproteobacteria bacterium]|nr:response regulator [Deltaproteobacteria bacterium]